MLTNIQYTQAQIQAKYNQLVCCFGEYMRKYAVARKAGDPYANVYLNKADEAFDVMYALDGWDCWPNGSTEGIFNPYESGDLANLMSYVTCNCANVSVYTPSGVINLD